MLLSQARMGSISKIIQGCKKIVHDEEETYHRRLKLKVSNRYVTLLSINEYLFSANSKENFRPNDIENSIPEGLRTKEYYSDISRILQWHVAKGVVNYDPDYRPETHPGRRKLSSGEIYSISGPRSFYSSNGYRLVFERVTRSFVSRAIIYTHLRDFGVLKRLFKVMTYNRLIAVRSTKPSRILKGFKAFGIGTEASFKESKYIRDQKILLQKSKKEIMSMASEGADKDVEEVDWHSRFYTEFFVVGGLTFYEDYQV